MKLETEKWKEFFLHKLFDCSIGSCIDSIQTTSNNPTYNYVTRSDGNNGVTNMIDKVDDVKPFKAGSITLALGGSIGSCYVQNEDFYTGQNVAVLQPREMLSTKIKLFIITIIKNECKIKYQAFGRELNAHYKKDFSIKLPIRLDDENQPIIDKKHKYSDEGYTPDWQFMEDYIKSLPYGDKI